MEQVANMLGLSIEVFIALMLWSMAWKGWALWVASQKNSKGWFIALFIVNTFGILEILYIFFFSKKTSKISSTKDEVIVEIETKE